MEIFACSVVSDQTTSLPGISLKTGKDEVQCLYYILKEVLFEILVRD